MKYIDYINRGFERCELNDTVQYEETGYKGYYLIKKITKKVTIQVWNSELDKPNIYIEQKEGEFISFGIDVPFQSFLYLFPAYIRIRYELD